MTSRSANVVKLAVNPLNRMRRPNHIEFVGKTITVIGMARTYSPRVMYAHKRRYSWMNLVSFRGFFIVQLYVISKPSARQRANCAVLNRIVRCSTTISFATRPQRWCHPYSLPTSHSTGIGTGPLAVATDGIEPSTPKLSV